MGLFTRLIGVDHSNVAFNAVLMQHALDTMPAEQMGLTYERLISTIMSGAPARMGVAEVWRMATRAGRITQLNLLAMAMVDRGQPPRLPSESWMPFVKNPFEPVWRSPAIWERVRAVEAALNRRHGCALAMPTSDLHMFDLEES